MKDIISIKKLLYKWPSQTNYLLDIKELSIKQGEKIFISGASGSGKTSLLSLLSGIIEPQSGSIEILNKDITALKSSQRDGFRANYLGYIFQQFNLLPYLSVIDNVILPCRFSEIRMQKVLDNNNKPEKEAKRLLEHLGIIGSNLLSKPVTELSVGQQQRVAAARALMGSPELLIADEPTSSLDADAQEAFIQLLFNECKNQDTSLVFVSHDTRFLSLFDRSLHLEKLNKTETQTIVEGGDL
ncbi:MAG: ABC transporter ATP-binding protein [Carboxylicivirga sp.]|jgi:putative ABC transport system ATP-binding protein|nr:ABC transporter ATP-binding protein [Carboxylicivirga sp.]